MYAVNGGLVPERRYLSAAEASRELGVSRATLSRKPGARSYSRRAMPVDRMCAMSARGGHPAADSLDS